MNNRLLNNYLLYIGLILFLIGVFTFEYELGTPLSILGIVLISLSQIKKKKKIKNQEFNIEDARKIIICPNCGAKNVVKNSNSKCEYCNSYIE